MRLDWTSSSACRFLLAGGQSAAGGRGLAPRSSVAGSLSRGAKVLEVQNVSRARQDPSWLRWFPFFNLIHKTTTWCVYISTYWFCHLLNHKCKYSKVWGLSVLECWLKKRNYLNEPTLGFMNLQSHLHLMTPAFHSLLCNLTGNEGLVRKGHGKKHGRGDHRD